MTKLTTLDQLKSLAGRSHDFVTGLIGEIAGTVADAIQEVADAKLSKVSSVSVSIPASGWQTDETVTDYTKYYDIAVTGVTANDRAEVTIAPGSLATAKACGLCGVCETVAGAIRVRAASVPTAAMAAEYWIADGKDGT